MSLKHFGLFGVIILAGLGCIQPAQADDQLLFADRFENPSVWYLDADGDGFGNPGVHIRSDTQPTGYVGNGRDCNDGDPDIHPGAMDDPDADLIDSNCDRIDGDVSRAIFVGPAGHDVPTCGTRENPCASPGFALTRVTAQRTQIYLQLWNYIGALNVTGDVAIYGGFDATWDRGRASPGGANSTLTGSIATMPGRGQQAYAIHVAPTVHARFVDIQVNAPNALGGTSGVNSHAFYIDGANLYLERTIVMQGNGASGNPGTAGMDSSSERAPDGYRGEDGNNTLQYCGIERSRGGASAVNSTCPAGGRSTRSGFGGDGGTKDTSCVPFGCANCDATPGRPGADAPVSSVVSGKGGRGGGTCESYFPTMGAQGVYSDGDGQGGLGGARAIIQGGLWTAPGADGAPGDNGGGGGGGGGAGGCDTGTDSQGGGGGGGGAGGCAATSPGTGGLGGGASFGVFALGGQVSVTQSWFTLGQGGKGGAGGRAGTGQPGGLGGLGGAAAGGSVAGASGGPGGRGGYSGAGGGGQGGSVYGIYSVNSTIDLGVDVQFSGGAAGQGGNGGFGFGSAMSYGSGGAPGAVDSIRTCAPPDIGC